MRLALIMTALFSLICACTNTPQRNVVIPKSETQREVQIVQLAKEFPTFAVSAVQTERLQSAAPTFEKGGSCSTTEALEAMPEISSDQSVQMAQFPVEYHAPIQQSLIL